MFSMPSNSNPYKRLLAIFAAVFFSSFSIVRCCCFIVLSVEKSLPIPASDMMMHVTYLLTYLGKCKNTGDNYILAFKSPYIYNDALKLYAAMDLEIAEISTDATVSWPNMQFIFDTFGRVFSNGLF